MSQLHDRIQADFPMLNEKVRGKKLVYLDNAATALKPRQVVERMTAYYEHENANIHRGAHFLATQGTEKYEQARLDIAEFIGAEEAAEIIFTRGTTNSINLAAQTVSELVLRKGDIILLTEMEHHSNIVPWQINAARHGARIEMVKVDANGEIDRADFTEKLNFRPKICAFSACSNALGTVNPVTELTAQAKSAGAFVLVDAAQAVAHTKTEVQGWNCDFAAFSAHKMFGPFGMGALYVRRELLELLPPYEGGGGMISEVHTQTSTWADVPFKFEGGTPNVAGALGFAEAVKYIQNLGWDEIAAHEKSITDYALERLSSVPGLKIFGNPQRRSLIFSFQLNQIHHSDLGEILDQAGVAIRVGHHCCQPLMRHLGVPGTARASMSIYNSPADIDALIEGLMKAREFF